MGGVYMMLRNMPSFMNSRLMYIHLVSLLHFEDVKLHGYGPVLSRLIADLKVLESTGIDVAVDKKIIRVKGAVVLLSGDYLGVHSILGFQVSFSQGHICKFCYATPDDIQSHHREADFKLRTVDEHNRDVTAAENDRSHMSRTGVKRNSPLNELRYFHAVQNDCVDMMHDTFEGVFQCEFKCLLQYFIFDKDNKRFTLHSAHVQ